MDATSLIVTEKSMVMARGLRENACVLPAGATRCCSRLKMCSLRRRPRGPISNGTENSAAAPFWMVRRVSLVPLGHVQGVRRLTARTVWNGAGPLSRVPFKTGRLVSPACNRSGQASLGAHERRRIGPSHRARWSRRGSLTRPPGGVCGRSSWSPPGRGRKWRQHGCGSEAAAQLGWRWSRPLR